MTDAKHCAHCRRICLRLKAAEAELAYERAKSQLLGDLNETVAKYEDAVWRSTVTDIREVPPSARAWEKSPDA